MAANDISIVAWIKNHYADIDGWSERDQEDYEKFVEGTPYEDLDPNLIREVIQDGFVSPVEQKSLREAHYPDTFIQTLAGRTGIAPLMERIQKIPDINTREYIEWTAHANFERWENFVGNSILPLVAGEFLFSANSEVYAEGQALLDLLREHWETPIKIFTSSLDGRLLDPDPEERVPTLNLLRVLGHSAFDTLDRIETLYYEDPSTEVRVAAGEAYNAITYKGGAAIGISGFNLRRAAHYNNEWWKKDGAINKIIQNLEHAEPSKRFQAAKELGWIASELKGHKKQALTALASVYREDVSPEVRRAARAAYWRISTNTSAPLYEQWELPPEGWEPGQPSGR